MTIKMKKKSLQIGVIDYGMGNLHSAAKALATTGASVIVSSSKNKLANNDLVVLPGVGAFGAAMTNLAKNKLDDFARGWMEDGKPFMGFCLGMQLLFEGSDEDRGVPGLGAMKGRVRAFRKTDFKSKGYQIPHMGWNTLDIKQDENYGVATSDSFYFVHSYFPEPNDDAVVFSTTTYGRSFCSVVAQGNIIATQFHPEKSGDSGLRLLKNVIKRWEKA
jgi:glutamine amidotransferase